MCMLCARHMDCTCRAIGLWERGAADSAGAMVGGEGTRKGGVAGAGSRGPGHPPRQRQVKGAGQPRCRVIS